jgi:hypothetical protein
MLLSVFRVPPWQIAAVKAPDRTGRTINKSARADANLQLVMLIANCMFTGYLLICQPPPVITAKKANDRFSNQKPIPPFLVIKIPRFGILTRHPVGLIIVRVRPNINQYMKTYPDAVLHSATGAV